MKTTHHQPRRHSLCRLLNVLTPVASLLALHSALADSGTWTDLNGGSWPNAANWSGGVIANGTDATANFGTLSLTGDTTVTLDGAQTVGSLVFGDQGASYNWFLNPGNGGSLALSVSTTLQTITVSNQTASIGGALSGSGTLSKLGTGNLAFLTDNALSTFSHITNAAAAGDLQVGALALSTSQNVVVPNAGATFTSVGTVSMPTPSSSDTCFVAGAGTWRLRSTNSSVSNPDILAPSAYHDDYGAQISCTLDTGAAGTTHYIVGYGNNNRFYSYYGDFQIGRNGSTTTGGSLTGAGNLYFYGYPSSSWNMDFVLFANNSAWTGGVILESGYLTLYNNNALTASNSVLLNPAAGETAILQPYKSGLALTIGALSSSGAGTAQVLAHYTQTLTINQNVNTTFAGYITNDSGTTLSIAKLGTGTLTLSGVNAYTGTTTVNGGALNLANGGSLSTGPVIVNTNATLYGTGTIGGATTIQAGGTLAIGAPTTGMLTLSNSLTLAAGSTNFMNINKTGGTLSSDSIQGLSSVTYGGTLVVANITSDGTALASGDTFQLFSAGSYAGTFNSTILPALPAGLGWDVSQLGNGSIAVVTAGTVASPSFNPPGGSYASVQTVTISSLSAGSTIYYTTDGSTPTPSSPHGVSPVTITVLATAPSETLTAYAALAGHPSSITNSATYTLNAGIWTNTVGGNWSDPGSWFLGIVANSSGIIANFNTLQLSGDITVTNDVGPTVGSLVFGDLGNSHNWIVADIGAGPIELDNGGNPPVITVSNQTATINTVLDDNGIDLGLTKDGNGTLNLFGANTYTGTTTVSAGTLGIGSLTLTPDSPISVASGAAVDSDGTLAVNADGSINPVIGLSGAGTLQLSSTTNSVDSPDIYFCANDVDNTTANWGSRLASPVNLGSQQRYIWGKSNHNGVGEYGVTEADCQFAAAISGTGGLTIIAQDSPDESPKMEVGFCLNASNNFTGPVEIQRGSVYLGAAGAFPAGDVLRFNVAAGNVGNFFLYGQNVAVSDLSATNVGTAAIANGNANPSAYGPVTLTVTQNNAAIFDGTITDTKAEYGVTSGTAATTLSLVKQGAAMLTLTGANKYSGPTTVAAGELVVSSAQTSAGAITVNDGAALGVTIAGTSQLAPATLTEGSTNGPVINEFTGLANPGTAPIIVGTLTLKGTTTINVLSGTLAPGTVYPLITFSTIGGTGSFVVGSLPANVVATVVTNGSSIALNVTAGNILTWNGMVNGTWDIASTANWTLNGVSGSTYTDGEPVVFDDTATGTTTINNAVTVSPFSITVNNTSKAYTISGSPIAGSAALTKNGNNALTLNGANTFTGNLAIGAGTVTIGGAGVLGGGTYAGSITDNGTLVYDSTTDQTNSGAIRGTGTLIQDGSDTLTLAANAPLTGGIAVDAGTLRVTTDDFGGQFTPSLITVNPNGTLFNDNYHALGQGTALAINGGIWVLNYEDYKTNITMIDGQINAGPGGDGGSLRWGPSGSAGSSTLLITNSVAGSVINEGMDLITAGNILTINVGRGTAASDLTINGIIINGGSLVKNGNGILTLTAANTYTGTTTVNGGTLALGASSSLAGPVAIQSGARLLVGATNASQVSISSTLTLAAGSTNVMRIDKTGGTLISDSIQGLTGVTYGGTLIVTNVTRDGTALAGGDTVQLFAATSGSSYAGGFTTFVLPTLPVGLSWDVSQLVNGSIAVVSTVSTPSFNPPGGSYASVQTVTISSLTPGATIYYTTNGSTPTTSSSHGVSPVTITVLATAPSETLTAYAALAGHPSSVTNSAAYTLSAGIWTNTVGGNWSDPGSWLFAIVANSSGITADFSTLTLAQDTTVTNDVGPTVGSLVFGDLGNAHNWIVADIGAGPIELDNGGNPPVITVSNQTATINTVLDDNGIDLGLTKDGNGTLNLFGANTYTGTTTVGAGTLGISSVTLTSDSPISVALGAAVDSYGTLAVNADGSINPVIGLSGAGTLQLSSTTNSVDSPDIYFCANDVDNTTANWGSRLASPVNLGNQQRYIWSKSNHNGVGEYGVTEADCQFAAAISGTGGLTIIAQDSPDESPKMEVGFCLNASNNFTGPVEIQRGSVYSGAAGAFPAGDVLRFNVADGNVGNFFLYGQNVTVSDLSATNVGTAAIANGNANPSAYGPVTLTVTQNNAATFSGTIADTKAEYGVTAGSESTILSLWKTGAAMLTLAGANTYSGTTTVSGGTLLVNGSLGAGAITVATGGTLGGTGTLGGVTTVQSGGTLAPGNNGLGTLTIGNTLVLAAGSSTTLAIDRTAGTANYGNVAGLTSATFGGTLTVASLGGTFQPGDSFQLFSVGSGSDFSAVNLPAISPLTWNWNPAAGTLSVVSGGSVNTTPTNITAVVSSGNLTLSWPMDQIGWRLLVQTNHLAAGVSSNPNDWATVAASASTNQVIIPVDATRPAEFYRLVYP